MIVKKLIEKIEGEAELEFDFQDGVIRNVDIKFNLYRGVEEILKNKAPRDALVITPRVCGICNHAHLIASVGALEDGINRSVKKFEITEKARDIREFTLACELIQNHIKWLYLTIFPNLNRVLNIQESENYALKAMYVSNTVTKALAIFAGQWPHSSYAVPGGVTCDPTFVEVMQAKSYIEDVIRFFENVVLGIKLEEFLAIKSVTNLDKLKGDFARILFMLGKNGFGKIGQSYDRFIVFGNSKIFKPGKATATTVSGADIKFVQEFEQEGSFAKAVKYKDKFFEAGPLARGIVAKEPVIKSMHKKYKDSTLTRVFARIYESAKLLYVANEILKNLRIMQDSCTLDSKIRLEEFEGIGVAEAARGSLIHKTEIENGKIKDYQIITPTQWNLANGAAAAKAMIGLRSENIASFVFKTFDVCSVCTTH